MCARCTAGWNQNNWYSYGPVASRVNGDPTYIHRVQSEGVAQRRLPLARLRGYGILGYTNDGTVVRLTCSWLAAYRHAQSCDITR